MTMIHKTNGSKYITYSITEKQFIFGDDEDLSINVKTRQKDEPQTIDICFDHNGDLVIGAATGFRYVAQIYIPGTVYEETTEGEGEDTQTVRTPKEFDINDCALYLYALEV